MTKGGITPSLFYVYLFLVNRYNIMQLLQILLDAAQDKVQSQVAYHDCIRVTITFTVDTDICVIPNTFNERIVRLHDLETLLNVLTIQVGKRHRDLPEVALCYRRKMVIKTIIQRICGRILQQDDLLKGINVVGTAGLGITFNAKLSLCRVEEDDV